MDNKLDYLDKKDGINKNAGDTPKDEIGLFRVNVKDLPSRGLFYPEDIFISIKPAEVKEIRHWSMIDENDEFSFLDAMNFIINNCSVIKTKNGILNINDLAEVDRLYLLFAIRDMTFGADENPIKIDIPYKFNGNTETDEVIVRKENLNYFEIPEKLVKYYNEEERAIIVTGDRDFNIVLPSVGVSNWVQDYLRNRVEKNKPFDEMFAKYASFLITDYRNMTEKTYFNMEVESKSWTIRDISVLDTVATTLSKGTKEGIKHVTEKGGEEVTVPLVFRDGIKSIFIISDILG